MTKQFNNRSDPRWAHPDLRGYREMTSAVYSEDNPPSPVKVPWPLYAPGLTRAERQKMQDDVAAALKESREDFKASLSRSERTKVIEYPSLPEFEHPATGLTLEYTVPKDFVPGKKKYCCLFDIPGGALGMCSPTDPEALSDVLGCIVVTPQYRTAFKEYGTYPYTINDLHSAYAYMLEKANEWGINKDKIVINGSSSGGTLALGFCHRLKKYGYLGHEPRGCMAMLPIPDERMYPSSKLYGVLWTGRCVFDSSRFWLNNVEDPMPDYAVPAEAFANHAEVEECIGLPPTVIVSDDEPCYDPIMQYVNKLYHAGVYTNFHIFGGMVHGEIVADVDYCKNAMSVYYNEIKNLFKNDLRRPWTVTENFD